MDACKLVGIGGLEIAQSPDKLKTVLGSCVGIVLHDPRMRIAGLAHAILPTSEDGLGEPGKFADLAVDNLIDVLTRGGARRNGLQAKLIGGANMFGIPTSIPLGERNAEAARERLGKHRIPIIAEQLGGTKGRKMIVDPETGRVEVELIGESKTVI
jgi:chemotaxis protein CheD